MKFYAAPMEGITGYVYRNAHHHFFPGIEKYFTPFITPNSSRKLTSRELNDVLPEHNKGISLVPQILGNDARNFCWCVHKLKDLGYEEINFNLGCPSKTVVSKGRGAGFLARPEALRVFLEEIFAVSPLPISIKMRLGLKEESEFLPLLALLSRYPVKELILHPRLQIDQYKGEARLPAFDEAAENCPFPLVFNGNLFTPERIRAFEETHPQIPAVMLGRGLIANPALAEGRYADTQTLRAFTDEIREGYLAAFRGDERTTIFHLKELWSYLLLTFPDARSEGKKILKATRLQDFSQATDALLRAFPACQSFRLPGSTNP